MNVGEVAFAFVASLGSATNATPVAGPTSAPPVEHFPFASSGFGAAVPGPQTWKITVPVGVPPPEPVTVAESVTPPEWINVFEGVVLMVATQGWKAPLTKSFSTAETDAEERVSAWKLAKHSFAKAPPAILLRLTPPS